MERQVKERLIGAAVLIAAAVILIPEMLSGPKRPAAVPPSVRAGEAPMKTYTIDLNRSLDSPAKVEVSAPPPEMPGSQPDLTATLQAPTQESGAESVSSEDTAESTVGDSPATAPAPKTESQRDRDVSSTKAAATNPDSVSGKSSTVKSRPEPARPAAVVAEKKKPVPAPANIPETPAPAATTKSLASSPAAPISASNPQRWAVQLGSFASKANADRLVKEWEGRGEQGLVSVIKSANGTLYRVRLGPFADRAKADATLRKVKPGIAGAAVVAHP